MNELEWIARIQNTCPLNPSVILGIGDDAAVLSPSNERQLLCKDMLLDTVHFHVRDTDPRRIGHKALAVNLSDIAAMGGEAQSAYIALALPRSLCHATFLDPLYEGLQSLAQSFGVAIAGGDTNIWDGPFAISVSVIGRCHARGFVSRSGARPGQIICVTGPLGDSYSSGHHLDFTPRLKEAKILLDEVHIDSMIDLSDGLGKDLRLICEQSSVMAVLDPDCIPLRESLLSRPREEALRAALTDGEDFELCFTLDPEAMHFLQQNCPELKLFPIGVIQPGQGMAWNQGKGGLSPISERGYEHRVEAFASIRPQEMP